MSDRQIARGGGPAFRALAGLAALLMAGCLGAVAYAATAHRSAGAGAHRAPASVSIPAPEIGEHPDKVDVSTTAKFDFGASRANLRFQCRLDRRRWKACRAPVVFTGLEAGSHRFSVRARDSRGRRGVAARFRWRLLEPKEFSIQPQLSGLSQLYPGAPPVTLPLVIANPNPVPIFVTSLQAAAAGGPVGCAGAENLALNPSSVSSAAPLKVPAKGTVTLPGRGVSPPAIALRNLPVNQDACQNAQFPLAFSGRARG